MPTVIKEGQVITKVIFYQTRVILMMEVVPLMIVVKWKKGKKSPTLSQLSLGANLEK
jgi:hypothetical protein